MNDKRRIFEYFFHVSEVPENLRKEFEQWYIANESDPDIRNLMLKKWNEIVIANKTNVSSSGIEKLRNEITGKNSHGDKMQKSRMGKFLYPIISVAAVIAVACVLTFTLTRDDGVQRYCNNSEMAMQIGLPDGTSVWINPDTELTIDKTFNDEERNVSLSGEAYFDVIHNPDCPFIVTTEKFRIKVLGTVFNVSARPGDEYPEVALASGSVALQNTEGVNLVKLHPGQQAVYDSKSEALEINDIYVGDMLMRHYGAVSLTKVTIKEIVQEISDVYGVEIEIEGDMDSGITYNFSFQKDSSIGNVLDMLEFVCRDLKFTLK